MGSQREERKQKREVLTQGGLIHPPHRTTGQLCSYQAYRGAGNTNPSTTANKGSPIYLSVFTPRLCSTQQTKQSVVCSKVDARNEKEKSNITVFLFLIFGGPTINWLYNVCSVHLGIFSVLL